jgi:DNA-binding transcriptional MerR regulator
MNNEYSMDQLCDATGQTPRGIRFLISEGFIPPPVGHGRWAKYHEAHVSAITHYEARRREGLSPSQIKAIMMVKPTYDRSCVLLPGIILSVDSNTRLDPSMVEPAIELARRHLNNIAYSDQLKD